MERTHRRAEIINALAELFETLTLDENIRESEAALRSRLEREPTDKEKLENLEKFPIKVKTVQKRFVHWTALDQQDALPALLLTYGDGGSAPDSEAVGYIDEIFPIAVTAVMKEEPHLKDLTDQASDIHYSIGQLINSDPTLSVKGVNPNGTRIASWRGSEGAISKFEIIRFRVVVVHRYHATENV